MKQTLHILLKWLSENMNSLLVAIIAAVVGGIILLIIQQLIKNKKKHKQQEEEKIEREQQDELIRKQQEEETRKWRERRKNELRYRPDKDKDLYYIQPYIKEVIPIENESEEKSGEAILLQNFFLEEKRGIFLKDPDKSYQTAFCILGDTGSGKTTALHYLYIDYIDQFTEMGQPHPIYFHYMGEDDVFDQIDKIENQRKCILLLDAIDENKMAQDPNTREQFMKKLGIVYKNFGFVVTTCRPQFYATLQEEIKKVRVGGKDHWLIVTRLRLQAFNKEQVGEYLRHAYSTNPQGLQKAQNFVNVIVSKDFKVEFRPLMLYYIEDFVNKNPEINTNLDLYDFIVKEQIRRDIDVFSHTTEKLIQPWWDMTSDVAFYLYSNHKDHLTAEELKNIISKHNENEMTEWKEILQSINIALSSDQIPSHLFQQRSLLTRTGNEFHFSHRSFYEYFMAYRFLLHPDEIMYVNGMDFALKLYDELCDTYLKNKKKHFITSSISHLVFASSFFKISLELAHIKCYKKAEEKLKRFLFFSQQFEKTIEITLIRTLAMTLLNIIQGRTLLKQSDVNDIAMELQKILPQRR